MSYDDHMRTHLHQLAEMLAIAWAEGFQAACDETPSGFTPDGPTDAQNPYVEDPMGGGA